MSNHMGDKNAAKRRWSRSGGLGQRGQFGHGPRVFNSRGLAVKSQEVQSVAPTLYGFDFEHAKDAFTGRARRDEELVSTVDAVSPKTASRGPQSNQFGSLWSPRSKLMEALRETKREQPLAKRALFAKVLKNSDLAGLSAPPRLSTSTRPQGHRRGVFVTRLPGKRSAAEAELDATPERPSKLPKIASPPWNFWVQSQDRSNSSLPPSSVQETSSGEASADNAWTTLNATTTLDEDNLNPTTLALLKLPQYWAHEVLDSQMSVEASQNSILSMTTAAPSSHPYWETSYEERYLDRLAQAASPKYSDAAYSSQAEVPSFGRWSPYSYDAPNISHSSPQAPLPDDGQHVPVHFPLWPHIEEKLGIYLENEPPNGVFRLPDDHTGVGIPLKRFMGDEIDWFGCGQQDGLISTPASPSFTRSTTTTLGTSHNNSTRKNEEVEELGVVLDTCDTAVLDSISWTRQTQRRIPALLSPILESEITMAEAFPMIETPVASPVSKHKLENVQEESSSPPLELYEPSPGILMAGEEVNELDESQGHDGPGEQVTLGADAKTFIEDTKPVQIKPNVHLSPQLSGPTKDRPKPSQSTFVLAPDLFSTEEDDDE